MSALAQILYTPEQYLEMERASRTRHEYYRGEIFAMAGGTQRHSLIITNAIFALKSQLKGGRCRVYDANMRILTGPNGLYTYPDVAVACTDRRYLDDLRDTLLNPILVVEVLSKSTRSYDRNEKFALYRQLPSFTDYLLIAQDRCCVEHFARQADGEWTSTEATDLDGAVAIPSLGCTLLLADIYDDVEFGEE